MGSSDWRCRLEGQGPSSCPNREKEAGSLHKGQPGLGRWLRSVLAPRQAPSDLALLPVHTALLHVQGHDPCGEKEVKSMPAELVSFKKLSKKLPQQQPPTVLWPRWPCTSGYLLAHPLVCQADTPSLTPAAPDTHLLSLLTHVNDQADLLVSPGLSWLGRWASLHIDVHTGLPHLSHPGAPGGSILRQQKQKLQSLLRPSLRNPQPHFLSIAWAYKTHRPGQIQHQRNRLCLSVGGVARWCGHFSIYLQIYLYSLLSPVLPESSSVVGSDSRSRTLSSRSGQGLLSFLGTAYWVELQRPWAISG
ncbi:uncharacterized protein LOC125100361 [Lutra lutra]|uniref:uncharacterized protein LOC125100361 n=1 Tax=Lutra lutra TaxID=9657 RepID=UPI001FD319BD|nr:uncharacterized protein LOC125100361 [Lutra lutra]